jgi:hypothetical protein
MDMSRTKPRCVGCGSAETPLQCDRKLPNTGSECRALLCKGCAVVVRRSRVARFVLHHCPSCAEARAKVMGVVLQRLAQVSHG